jgi:hypothetical protein
VAAPICVSNPNEQSLNPNIEVFILKKSYGLGQQLILLTQNKPFASFGLVVPNLWTKNHFRYF